MTYGYPLLFFILLIESVGIPSPSELSLIFAGVLAGEGHLSLPLVVLVSALGSVVGANISYWIAVRGGRVLILRYGVRVGLNAARLDQVEEFFRARGDVAVLVGRLISGVRAIISYPAGLFEMPYPRFLVFTSIGAVLWPMLAAGGGYLVGPHWHALAAWLERAWLVVIVGLLVAGGIWYYLRQRRRRAQGQPPMD